MLLPLRSHFWSHTPGSRATSKGSPTSLQGPSQSPRGLACSLSCKCWDKCPSLCGSQLFHSTMSPQEVFAEWIYEILFYAFPCYTSLSKSILKMTPRDGMRWIKNFRPVNTLLLRYGLRCLATPSLPAQQFSFQGVGRTSGWKFTYVTTCNQKHDLPALQGPC